MDKEREFVVFLVQGRKKHHAMPTAKIEVHTFGGEKPPEDVCNER